MHDDALALIAAEDVGREAVFLVEYLVDAHILGVGRRVDEVGNHHAYIAGGLCLENVVENLLEVGVRRVAHAGCRCIDVAVLQEAVHCAVIGVDAVVNDVNLHLVAAREVVDEVVNGLLELAATASVVIGHHAAAALKVDGE